MSFITSWAAKALKVLIPTGPAPVVMHHWPSDSQVISHCSSHLHRFITWDLYHLWPSFLELFHKQLWDSGCESSWVHDVSKPKLLVYKSQAFPSAIRTIQDSQVLLRKTAIFSYLTFVLLLRFSTLRQVVTLLSVSTESPFIPKWALIGISVVNSWLLRAFFPRKLCCFLGCFEEDYLDVDFSEQISWQCLLLFYCWIAAFLSSL